MTIHYFNKYSINKTYRNENYGLEDFCPIADNESDPPSETNIGKNIGSWMCNSLIIDDGKPGYIVGR